MFTFKISTNTPRNTHFKRNLKLTSCNRYDDFFKEIIVFIFVYVMECEVRDKVLIAYLTHYEYEINFTYI